LGQLIEIICQKSYPKGILKGTWFKLPKEVPFFKNLVQNFWNNGQIPIKLKSWYFNWN